MAALILALTSLWSSLPSPADTGRLFVGPVAIGQTAQAVQRTLGGGKRINMDGTILMEYEDGRDQLLLYFAKSRLFRILIHRLSDRHIPVTPRKYGEIRHWKWAGGEVSRPPQPHALGLAGAYWRQLPGSNNMIWDYRSRTYSTRATVGVLAGVWNFELGI